MAGNPIRAAADRYAGPLPRYAAPISGDLEQARDVVQETLILLYDDKEQDGSYQCVMADGHGEHMRANLVKEQFRKRGK